MPGSKLTSKGQITLPKPIRDHLHLRPGQIVDFEIDDRGGVRLHAKNVDLLSLAGILKRKRGKRLTIEAMNEAIARGYAGK